MSHVRSFDHRFDGIIKRVTTVFLLSDLSPGYRLFRIIHVCLFFSWNGRKFRRIFCSREPGWREHLLTHSLSRYGRHGRRRSRAARLRFCVSDPRARKDEMSRPSTRLQTAEEHEMPLTRCSRAESASDMKRIASRAAPRSLPPNPAPAAPLRLGLGAALPARAQRRAGYVIQ